MGFRSIVDYASPKPHSTMRNTRFAASLGQLLLVSSLAIVSLTLACGDEPAPRIPYEPNPIIVITVDTLRADHIGTYGYFRETMPFLTLLAEEAVLFEKAWAPIATTLPAHVSLWTSQYPVQTGVVMNGSKFRPPMDGSVSLFYEMLAQLGYQTAGFVSASPVKAKTGISFGMEFYDQPEKNQHPANVTTDRALEWLESTATSPFFLWVHYFDPHAEYDPPEPYRSKFDSQDDMREFLETKSIPNGVDRDLINANNLYDGEIAFVDSQVHRLVEALKEKGWYDEATIVLTADHGEGLGQHGLMGHGHVYNETLRVPLVIKFPDSAQLNGRTIADHVSLIDVVPTLVSTLSLPLTQQQLDQLEGVNALDPSHDREYIFAHRTFRERKRKWGRGQKFVLIWGNWKYHHSTHAEDELYDLGLDPIETQNRIQEQPRVVRQLKDKLFELIAQYSDDPNTMEVLEDTSPETLRELRALGYIR